MKRMTDEQLEELRKFDTPTICNAIESFGVRSNTEGYMGPEIRCILPFSKPVVGYAVTGKISAQSPPSEEQKKLVTVHYKNLSKFEGLKIAVLEDIDPEPLGSFWGGVNTSIHMVFNCNSVITNGGVRDLKDAEEAGFAYFAKCVLVSHANVHLTEVGSTVNIGGIEVEPGDLLHADIHGVVKIPEEVSGRLVEACREVIEAENFVIDRCRKRKGMGMDIEDLQALRRQMYQLRDRKRK